MLQQQLIPANYSHHQQQQQQQGQMANGRNAQQGIIGWLEVVYIEL